MSTASSTAIVVNKQALIERASELIRVPTVNPPGEQYLPCARTLVRQCRAVGLKTRLVRIPDEQTRASGVNATRYPRAIVLGRWETGAEKTVHFNAHYDVVPAAAEGWRFGAFEPTVSDGWLYGRGSADMKGAIASLLEAIDSIRAVNGVPAVNVEVSFTPDEETDSVLGAEWLVRNGLVDADYAVICEGGSGRRVGCGHNGVLWFEVEVRGKAAHGSQPGDGINAVEQMSRLVLELAEYGRLLERRKFRNPDGRIRTATINVGGVVSTGSGAKINTVPGVVSFSVDRRVLPNEDLEEAERDFRDFVSAAARRIRRSDVKVHRIGRHTATFTDPSHPFLKAFGASLSKIRGESTRFTVSTGFNDSHFFVGECGLPTLGWGPAGENCHGDNERVRVAELIEAAQVYAHFLTTFAG